MVKHYAFRKSEITKHIISRKYISDMSDLALLVGIGEEELSKALIRGLPAKLRWHVVNFNPTTLSETIQRILLGEATLSFDDNEHINVVSENGMATTVQRMDERLDKLEDLLKSCQLSRTTYPAEQNDQPLQSRTINLYRDHLVSTAEHVVEMATNRQNAFVHLMAIPRGLINVSTTIHATTTMITFLTEGTTISTPSESFQPRAIRGSYNPRYYNSGVERGYNRNYSQNGGFQKNSIPPRV